MNRKTKTVGHTDQKPQQRKTAIHLPLEVHRELASIAKDDDLTLAEVVVIAVDEYLARRRRRAAAAKPAKATKAKAKPKTPARKTKPKKRK